MRTMPAAALPDDRSKMDCIPTSSAHDDIANLKNGTEQICPLALDDRHADSAASFISTESIPILISTPLSTFQAPPSDTTTTIPTGKSALNFSALSEEPGNLPIDEKPKNSAVCTLENPLCAIYTHKYSF
ncbi:hypothetical protein K439DRAFT_926553 [Ramaria rubella]|nr:hypothetical protein K439DRAFT_926553 [Ramaria rubella]